jgi:hypothetical protein
MQDGAGDRAVFVFEPRLEPQAASETSPPGAAS